MLAVSVETKLFTRAHATACTHRAVKRGSHAGSTSAHAHAATAMVSGTELRGVLLHHVPTGGRMGRVISTAAALHAPRHRAPHLDFCPHPDAGRSRSHQNKRQHHARQGQADKPTPAVTTLHARTTITHTHRTSRYVKPNNHCAAPSSLVIEPSPKM